MLNLILWENKKEIKRVRLNESELSEALAIWLLSRGYIDLDKTWEIEIESIVR